MATGVRCNSWPRSPHPSIRRPYTAAGRRPRNGAHSNFTLFVNLRNMWSPRGRMQWMDATKHKSPSKRAPAYAHTSATSEKIISPTTDSLGIQSCKRVPPDFCWDFNPTRLASSLRYLACTPHTGRTKGK